MKQTEKRKKAILLLYTYLIILLTPKIKAHNKSNITYTDNYNICNKYIYATYNNRNVYIANRLFITILQAYDSNGIYIIDNRNKPNPTMSICNSYKIISPRQITDIIEILMQYEEQYPSNWDRTVRSLKNEWILHNICYYLNHEIHRTNQVDLDNNDEAKYIHYLESIYKTIEDELKLKRSKK